MPSIPTKALTFEDFVAQYRNDFRYELADGELIDTEPTGPHEMVSGQLAGYVGIAINNAQRRWFIPRSCLLKPFAGIATARRPDVIVLDETMLANEPLWDQEAVIIRAKSIKLVVEVVGNGWENDYTRKAEEYALLGIPEYWSVDFRGRGGMDFIGKPKQPTFTVCQLSGDEYRQQQYRLGDVVSSPLLPNLQLRLDDVLPQ
ncbi:Uma2 family endonuclease [Romeria aff. gracilis LEGE 07310]|uniref:Uma2 family endonuclease n=1 Tax=Vasconcelosia minhoensis LEGE 07310 TaxID=915328 RepID=A0A8J7A8J9_9CYAN|nr:Uma2 family endonuclease [Romeria gracilis]MBE9079142.1 Uma2 family endonuclease [Romeria aff. gracilis LEGE 07310]